jgi:hypothetical protein
MVPSGWGWVGLLVGSPDGCAFPAQEARRPPYRNPRLIHRRGPPQLVLSSVLDGVCTDHTASRPPLPGQWSRGNIIAGYGVTTEANGLPEPESNVVPSYGRVVGLGFGEFEEGALVGES